MGGARTIKYMKLFRMAIHADFFMFRSGLAYAGSFFIFKEVSLMVQKQSNFSRSLANDAKMGAYYTDREHCRRIGMLVEFPAEEVSVLEPCIGDGTALREVLSGKGDNVSIFAVELNGEVYQEHIKNNPKIAYSLNADFLTGIKASHKSFGFCFANPPYGEDEMGVRLEQKFVEKLYPYMKPQAPIALVVPHYTLVQEKFLSSFFARFEPIMTYRFDDDVFCRFKQVAVIGIRRKVLECSKESQCSYKEEIAEVSSLPYLPKEEKEAAQKVAAVASSQEGIEYFATLEFDAGAAAGKLDSSHLYRQLEKAFVPKYVVGNLNRPVIPLKTDLLYLLAVCGGGQGLVGSEEGRDLHLQRGVAKVVETGRLEGEGKLVEKIKTSTRVELNIIENDGKITTLS